MMSIERHIRAEHAAADAAFTDRMRAIYVRLGEITDQRHALTKERNALLAEVCKSIGIEPGVVIEANSGKGQVVSAVGEFFYDASSGPGEPYRVYPAASCEVAPATKDGFHARTRVRVRHIDTETSFMALHGKPLPPCPECGASMQYDEGEPHDGPSWGCPECGHKQPEERPAPKATGSAA